MQHCAEENDEHNDHLQYVGQVNEFITKTFDMIEYCQSRYPDIASWSEDGSQFFIKDPRRLEMEVIPKYFNHDKYSSFSRQLNFYSFKKTNSNKKQISTDGNFGTTQFIIYEHHFFKRDKAELLPRIKRSTYRKRKGDFSKDIDQFQRDLDSMNQEIENLEGNLDRAIKNVAQNLDLKLNQLDSLLGSKKRKLNQTTKIYAPTARSRYSSVELKGFPLLGTAESRKRQTSDISLFNFTDLYPPNRQGSVDSAFISSEIEKNWGSAENEAILNRQGSCNSTSWLNDFAENWSYESHQGS